MSGTATPPAKTMSSRLLTMKFMQRAAAASPASSSPSTPDLPSPKRRKTESGSTPTKFDVDALADQRAIQAAMASEEAKRLIALDKQGNELGDTRWVLNFKDQTNINGSATTTLKVVSTGFASLDQSGGKVRHYRDPEPDGEPAPAVVGRRSFGKFNRDVEKQNDPNPSDLGTPQVEAYGGDGQPLPAEDDSSESEDDTATYPTNNSELLARLKAERKARKKAKKAASAQMAKDRRKTEVSLNGLSSISGRQETRPSIKCYNCEGPHMKADCPLLGPIKCFNCEGPHRKADCPELNKRRFDGDRSGDEGPKRKVTKRW